ncbi:MAG: hypothetical protein ACK5H1_09170 [Tenacibaculum sp.]
MLFKKQFFLYKKIKKLFETSINQSDFLLFFRMTISIVAIIEITSLLKDLPLFFSFSKTIIPQELMYLQSSYFKYLHSFYQFLNTQGFIEFFYKIAVPVYLIALVFLFLGLFTRLAAGIALVLQLLIFKSFSAFNYGYDFFLTMSLFYSLIFPLGRFYSIDAKLFKYNSTISFNYCRVIQIHLGIAYFFSGIAKGLDSGWWDGNSVWKALVSADSFYYAIPSFLFVIASIATVLLEFFYPILIFIKKTHIYTLTAIIIMHTLIAITMGLYAFSALMIVWNVAAFGFQNKKINYVEAV